MAKTATNTLVGLRVQDGKLAITNRALLPEWSGEGDERREITLDELLHMTSGLDFKEDYDGDDGDVRARCLFFEGDKSGFAAAEKPSRTLRARTGTIQAAPPTSSPAFCIDTFAEMRQDYLRYPRERLFEPLGMHSAVFRARCRRHLRRLILPLRHGARLGAARPFVFARRRMAGPAFASRRLGCLQRDAGACTRLTGAMVRRYG